MKYTKQPVMWTSRSLFVIIFLCCIAIARCTEVDPRFDKGSANLAIKFQELKGSIPHDRIPDDAEKLKDPGSWAQSYGIGLAKVVGPGFVIAFLSVLGGILYGIFKLVRMCCCTPKEKSYTSIQRWVPTVVYGVCWVFLLTGMIFGLLNNPRFSDGIVDLGDYVVGIGNNAIELGDGLLDTLNEIVTVALPRSISGLLGEFAGIPELADEVDNLAIDVDGTANMVYTITTQVSRIDAGNLSVLNNLNSELNSINEASYDIIDQVSALTYQISDKLRSTLNETVGTLNENMDKIDNEVGGIEDTARDIINQAADLVDKVTGYVNDGKSYDSSRGKAVTAFFIVIIVVTVAIGAGYIVQMKLIFNIIAAISFLFLFLLWFSGSIHFLLSMVLFDACPIMDTAVKGMLPSDESGSGAEVLQECLFGNGTVLNSLNVTAFNLSDAFDYRSQFSEVADFANDFNFTAIDSYFDSIQGLYTYNLTEVAHNLTAASFGWNETYVYQSLDVLNNLTYPNYYNLNNYSTVNPDNYPSPLNQSVYIAKLNVTYMVVTNETIYNKTTEAQQQLISAQTSIDNLLAQMRSLRARYDGIKTEVDILSTDNITACIAILDGLQSNITAFFDSANCSFVGETYRGVQESLCETMQPAIDLLAIAQFLAGLALIPMTIVAEILGYRIAASNRIGPCGDDEEADWEEEETSGKKYSKKNGKCDYAVALTDSPAAARHSGLTATIAADRSTPSSTNSSPNSTPNYKRRMLPSDTTDSM